MADRRLVRRRPDADAYSTASYTYAHINSTPSYPHTDAEPRPWMQRGSDLDRDRDLYRRAARESERRHLRSKVVDSKPESRDQLRPGRPLAAHRPLRHAVADANASSYAYTRAYTNAYTAADRVAQDNRILRSMGHLRPQLQGEGPGHHRYGEQVDAH